MSGWAIASIVCAAVPAVMYFRNALLYRQPPLSDSTRQRVSVLIPARNEELAIGPAIAAVLASSDIELEVIVLDDQSTDATTEIVRLIAATDSRVKLIPGTPPPPGWAGKQFACHTLAANASHPVLVFLDADVRVEPTALARLDAYRRQSGAALVSGFPRQQTGTLLESLLIPLIHFILLGFLPFDGMRWSRRSGFGAGCGQMFLTTAEDYRKVGGHSHPLVRGSFHDGVKLPRAYRTCGLSTDLCDLTVLATCRMYRTAGQVWRGLSKNAGEGLGSPGAILFWTAVLLLGQVYPFVELAGRLISPASIANEWPWFLVPAGLEWAVRSHMAGRFRQSFLSVILHPVGVLVLLVIQWYALLRTTVGQPVGWKGRTQPVTRPLPPGPPSP